MRHSSRVVFVAITLIVVIIAAGFLSHGTLGSWLADLTGRVLSPLAERIGYGRAIISVLSGRYDLVQENIDLKTSLDRANAAAARADELVQENQFLRSSIGLQQSINKPAIEAGIFGYLREGGSREFIINKGQSSSVNVGDVVVTSSGALLGLIKNVFEDHSRVVVINDPSLEVTARVVGTNIAGLLRTDPQEGLILDLIQKSETVSEGQSIATSGNDHLPAGILIGTVRSVDTESSKLFKVVRITLAAPGDFSGKVLIFHP